MVILAAVPLQAGEDVDPLDLEGGCLVLSAISQYGGRWDAQALLDCSNFAGGRTDQTLELPS